MNKEELEQYRAEKGFALPYKPNYIFIDTEEEALKALEHLKTFEVLSVDTETTGLSPYNSKLLLIQIATPELCYILNCTKVDPKVWSPIFTDLNILKILQNAKFDYKFIKVFCGVSMRPLFDTFIAEALITAGTKQPLKLNFIALKYLGIEINKGVRTSFIGQYKTDFSLIEKLYAANDALILHNIYNDQVDILERDGLLNIAMLEFRTIVPIAEMELMGSRVDSNKWRLLVEVARKHMGESEIKVKDILDPVSSQRDLFGGCSINLGSPAQLLAHLTRLGIKVPGRQGVLEPIQNTQEETLKQIAHPIGPALIEYRGWEKICNAYGEKFLEKIDAKTGRLYAELSQMGAGTGRTASKNPNLQQVPGFNPEDETTLDFRSCFIASPGYKLVVGDYPQQELRILAELSKDEKFAKAFTLGVDLHTRTAIDIWGGTEEEVKQNGNRKKAKSINFLISYGGQAYTLAKRLGMDEDEAQKILNAYFSTYPRVKKYIEEYGEKAISNGYSVTLGGRRRYYDFPTTDDEKYDSKMRAIRRKGANHCIQGTAADIGKQAICHFFYELEKLNLDAHISMFIHDEIVCEAKVEHATMVAKLLEECMVRAFKDFCKKISITVEACIDDTWRH